MRMLLLAGSQQGNGSDWRGYQHWHPGYLRLRNISEERVWAVLYQLRQRETAADLHRVDAESWTGDWERKCAPLRSKKQSLVKWTISVIWLSSSDPDIYGLMLICRCMSVTLWVIVANLVIYFMLYLIKYVCSNLFRSLLNLIFYCCDTAAVTSEGYIHRVFAPPLLGKKWRVLCCNRPCDQDCWHSVWSQL